MKTGGFREELLRARDQHYAVGAFNIFNDLSARAVIKAASERNLPVILQTSVKTVRAFGPGELGSMLRRLAEEAPVPVCIHLDHCTETELAKECVDAGWDAVMFDGSHLPLEENIACCREVAEYAHRRGAEVEGELGRIGGVEEHIVVEEGEQTGAELEESVYFVKESGIDAFAPAVGTAHGLYKGAPCIDYELVEKLRTAVSVPVVIHGGTGLSRDTFLKLIRLGAAKINVSTALKHAYIDGCGKYLSQYPGRYDPLDIDGFLSLAIRETAGEHMDIFSAERVL